MHIGKRTCFFIAPIGGERSPERNRSDWVLKLLIRPALGNKYRVVRADQISKPGSINDQIIQQIADCDLSVVDLTGLNANVVYELAVRHTLNRPTVQMMDQDQRLPFDLYGERTIFFKHDDVESLERARTELRRFVRETERDSFKSTSPVSRSIDIANLREQSTGVTDALASILEEIIAVKNKLDDVDTQTSSIESNVDDIQSTVGEIEGILKPLSPQQFGRGGLYVDDSRLLRMFEDIDLVLKRIARRGDPGR